MTSIILLSCALLTDSQNALREDNQNALRGALTYAQGYHNAIRTGKPLVTFVGMPAFQIKGSDALIAEAATLREVVAYPDGFPARCVLVSVPSGDTLKWFRTIEQPTEANLWAAIRDSNGLGPEASTRAPQGHTHTCPRCETTWDHAANATHNCANCGTAQYVQDSRPRPVTVKVQVKPQADPFAPAVEGVKGLPVGSVEALDEVNAKRAARGLRPFIRDDNLTLGAAKIAVYLAARRQDEHTSNDFAFLPSGCSASAGGLGAADLSWGWISCCYLENYTHAGAAYAWGSDKQRYMYIFVRNEGGSSNAASDSGGTYYRRPLFRLFR